MSDQEIVAAWRCNAGAWTSAVREQQIASRVAVTDAAIIQAILERRPASLLDIGCGEGWLLRALADTPIQCFGVDVVDELILSAGEQGGGEFSVMSYHQLAQGAWQRPVAMVVCNFSLLGEDDVAACLAAVPNLLLPGGRCLIQTLHPAFCDFGPRYESGWRQGSWQGFGEQFKDPAPWYFRNLSGWLALFQDSGLLLTGLREPLFKDGAKPASIIFELAPLRPGKEHE